MDIRTPVILPGDSCSTANVVGEVPRQPAEPHNALGHFGSRHRSHRCRSLLIRRTPGLDGSVSRSQKRQTARRASSESILS